MKLLPIDKQVIVVTGASSGIGLATATLLASKGARVMLVARDGEALAKVVDEIVKAGGKADYIVADVGDRAQLEQAATKAVTRFGAIDTWVNNAGVAIYAKLADTPDEEHERLFRTNYFGVVNGSVVALKHMRQRGGAIVNMGTIGAQVPSPILSAYTASKFAMRAFSEALRQELKAEGTPVSVTLLLPAGVATPLAEHAAVHVDGEPRIPSPTYDPDVVARAVLDAATHPRGTVHVGGQGIATTLAATHIPGLQDNLGKTTEAVLVAKDISPNRTNNLFGPFDNGRIRSRIQSGRRHSSYNAVLRVPAVARFGVLAAAMAFGALARCRLKA
jgi:short-subunit dehydrogenase